MRVVEAAIRLFLDRGYVDTTVQVIADDAGVAPAAIYQAFGTKHAVLAAALAVTVAGDDAMLVVLDRGWSMTEWPDWLFALISRELFETPN